MGKDIKRKRPASWEEAPKESPIGDQFDILRRSIKRGDTLDTVTALIERIGLEGDPEDFDGSTPIPTKENLAIFVARIINGKISADDGVLLESSDEMMPSKVSSEFLAWE